VQQQDTTHAMQPVAAHAAGEAVPQWTCRECCARLSRRYVYAEIPDTYCAACGGPMSDVELLATVMKLAVAQRALAERDDREAPAPTPGPLMDVEETADLLRSTPGAIRARAERGLLPGLQRDGRRLLVRRDVLLRSLERRAPSPGRSR
jgi:hypothetical protein